MKNIASFLLLSMVLMVGCEWDLEYVPCECPEEILDERDGQVYRTIQIGSQCWMQENLRYVFDDIEYNQIDQLILCDTLVDNCEVYYKGAAINLPITLSEIIDGNICPEGWHVSTDVDWLELEKNYLRMRQADLGLLFISSCAYPELQDSIIESRGQITEDGGEAGIRLMNPGGFNAHIAGFYVGTTLNNTATFFWAPNDYSVLQYDSKCDISSDNFFQGMISRRITSTSNGIVRGVITEDYGGCVRCVKD